MSYLVFLAPVNLHSSIPETDIEYDRIPTYPPVDILAGVVLIHETIAPSVV